MQISRSLGRQFSSLKKSSLSVWRFCRAGLSENVSPKVSTDRKIEFEILVILSLSLFITLLSTKKPFRNKLLE